MTNRIFTKAIKIFVGFADCPGIAKQPVDLPGKPQNAIFKKTLLRQSNANFFDTPKYVYLMRICHPLIHYLENPICSFQAFFSPTKETKKSFNDPPSLAALQRMSRDQPGATGTQAQCKPLVFFLRLVAVTKLAQKLTSSTMTIVSISIFHKIKWTPLPSCQHQACNHM